MAEAHRQRGQRDPGRERFWREALARFRVSGLSVRSFCRQEKLGEPLFYAWRRTIAERDGAPASGYSAASKPALRRAAPKCNRLALRKPLGARQPAPFLPVVMADEAPAPSAADLMIELRGGRTLRFADSTPARRVAEVVRALALEAMEAAS